MKRVTLLLIGLCLVASCTSPKKEKQALDSHPPPAVNLPATTEGKPVWIQASKNGATSNPTLPVSNLQEEKTYELPRFLVHGEFQMSFGFGVKILKDGLTRKVMMMYVDSVDPDSDAWKKGLESGTRIIAIEGKPVTEFDATFSSGSELNRIFSARNRGANVLLEVITLGSQTARTITIVERPAKFDSDNWVLDRIK